MIQGIFSLKNEKSFISKNNNLDNFLPVRVTDIILNKNHPKFNDVGGWDNIGAIFFENIIINNNKLNTFQIAKPINSNNKFYPLIDEIVYIYRFPTPKNIEDLENNYVLYYFNPINLWNSPHHNAYPKTINSSESLKNINQNNFIENNINSLIPSSGDYIIEGRFGNSIRLGSTNNNDNNVWSNNTKNSDPIIIIRNTINTKETENPWDFIYENINIEDTSLYLTSTQKIQYNYNINFDFLDINPIELSDYNKSQLSIKSSRILLNSLEGGTILNSSKYIILNSKDLGIKNKKTIIDSPNINLGSKDANDYVILGDTYLQELKQVLISLNSLVKGLKSLKDWPGGTPTPNIIVPLLSDDTTNKIQNLLNKINSPKKPLLSKTTKVK